MAVQTFEVTNTGEAEDLIRVKPSSAAGWATSVGSAVLDVPAGQTVEVPVYVKVPARAKKPSTLTLTATSETEVLEVGLEHRDGQAGPLGSEPKSCSSLHRQLTRNPAARRARSSSP